MDLEQQNQSALFQEAIGWWECEIRRKSRMASQSRISLLRFRHNFTKFIIPLCKFTSSDLNPDTLNIRTP